MCVVQLGSDSAEAARKCMTMPTLQGAADNLALEPQRLQYMCEVVKRRIKTSVTIL